MHATGIRILISLYPIPSFSSSSSPPFLGLLTYARPIAPRRGALQKKRLRMRSCWRADGPGRRLLPISIPISIAISMSPIPYPLAPIPSLLDIGYSIALSRFRRDSMLPFLSIYHAMPAPILGASQPGWTPDARGFGRRTRTRMVRPSTATSDSPSAWPDGMVLSSASARAARRSAHSG